jgi:hypothetical protein
MTAFATCDTVLLALPLQMGTATLFIGKMKGKICKLHQVGLFDYLDPKKNAHSVRDLRIKHLCKQADTHFLFYVL